MLTTDDNGRMQFSFTAPNANTTWKLCAVAFSRDLLSGSLTREIISSKPVMAQPNLPRFLRTGDTATILASVMNNTDSAAVITTTVEIFDPVSGDVVQSTSHTDSIAAKGSAIVPVDITIPEGSNMTGYRIRSTSGNFTARRTGSDTGTALGYPGHRHHAVLHGSRLRVDEHAASRHAG